jgi:hypothetical protein
MVSGQLTRPPPPLSPQALRNELANELAPESLTRTFPPSQDSHAAPHIVAAALGPSTTRTARDSFPASIIPPSPDTEEEVIEAFDVEGFVSAEPSTIPPPPDAIWGQAREQRIADMRVLFSQGHFDRALTIADSVLAEQPLDAYAREYVATCLLAMLGPRAMTRVPRVTVARNELSTLPLDPRAAFVLMHIDGMATIEMVLDVCAMPEHEALRLLVQLKNLGVARFE